ncbi:MAG: thymidine kinase [Deinococcus sp.]|nr:thymidine kinase [Deinococcus sp.]
MTRRFNSGYIEVIAGPMFSGKSEELLRRIRRARIAHQRVQVFKPAIDIRYAGNAVASHDGRQTESVAVHNSAEIRQLLDPAAEVVAIDEVQFLDEGIVPLVRELADRGIRVVIAGLDMDFRAEPFGAMDQLLAIAESVDKLTAVCVKCSAPATRTQRLVNGQPARYDDPVVLVGAAESYEARCRICHQVRRSGESRAEV